MKPSNVLQDAQRLGPSNDKALPHRSTSVGWGMDLIETLQRRMFYCVRYGSILTFSVVLKFSFGSFPVNCPHFTSNLQWETVSELEYGVYSCVPEHLQTYFVHPSLRHGNTP